MAKTLTDRQAAIAAKQLAYHRERIEQIDAAIHEPHHRIVRIPPGESVVLNSAERAPYLLLIEILHTDLDFDPNKRSNKEILKKIVLKEGNKDIDPFSGTGNPSRQNSTVPETTEGPEVTLGFDTAETSDDVPAVDSNIITKLASPISPAEEEEEEMDLVEQLYGENTSLRANELDLSESIVLPPQPKNRELDMAKWSQGDALNPSSTWDIDTSVTESPTTKMSAFGIRRSESTSSTHQKQPSTPRILSLDEYSERMRTAAVMLAQLNASLVREPATTILPPSASMPPSDSSSVLGSPLRWLTGPSASGSASSSGAMQDSLASPALHGSAPTRMKLQLSEAAAIRERIMNEMLALEEERVSRMRENITADGMPRIGLSDGNLKTAEDEGIIRRELSKADPSAIVFSESWSMKKVSSS